MVFFIHKVHIYIFIYTANCITLHTLRKSILQNAHAITGFAVLQIKNVSCYVTFYMWFSLKNFIWWIKKFLGVFWCSLNWAENFRMMDIKINACSSLFLSLETNLILCLYPEKWIKFNQSELRIPSQEIWNFARHLRLIYKKGGTLS